MCAGRLFENGRRHVANTELQLRSAQHSLRIRTDESGEFSSNELMAGETYTAYVKLPSRSTIAIPCESSAPIRSGARDLEVRVSSQAAAASITAQFHAPPQAIREAPDDLYAIAARIEAGREIGATFSDRTPPLAGTLRFSKLLPGDYRITIGSEAEIFPEFEVLVPQLRSGETRALGFLEAPAAAKLQIEIRGAPADSFVYCAIRNLETQASISRAIQGKSRSFRLTPSTYEVLVHGSDVMPTRQRLKLTPAKHERLHVHLKRASRRFLDLSFPSSLSPSATFDLELRDAQDKLIDLTKNANWPLRYWPNLATGSYKLRVSTRPTTKSPSQRYTGKFTIENKSPHSHFVRVPLHD